MSRVYIDKKDNMKADFDVFFRKYEKNIFNLIYRMVDNYEDAVDLTAQTFLQALRGYDNFKGQSNEYTWIYRIAVNLCKNHYRKKERVGRVNVISLNAAPENGTEFDIEDKEVTDPLENVTSKELQRELMLAINELTPELRESLLLRDANGLSYQEIVEVTGCTLETIKSRIFRARTLLRDRLSPILESHKN